MHIFICILFYRVTGMALAKGWKTLATSVCFATFAFQVFLLLMHVGLLEV